MSTQTHSWLLGWPRRRTDSSPWIHTDLQDSVQRRPWDHQQVCLHQERVRLYIPSHAHAHTHMHPQMSLIASVFVIPMCRINQVVSELLCSIVICLEIYILTFGPLKGPNCVFTEKLQGALFLGFVFTHSGAAVRILCCLKHILDCDSTHFYSKWDSLKQPLPSMHGHVIQVNKSKQHNSCSEFGPIWKYWRLRDWRGMGSVCTGPNSIFNPKRKV